MKIKKLSPLEWETERTPNDFHISFEDGRYVVDVFRSDIRNPDEAHIACEEFDNWEDVEAYCERDFDTPAASVH